MSSPTLLERYLSGELHPSTKLTARQALAIRCRLRALALEYGVSESEVSRIKNGLRWACLEEGRP